jgi:hypothetical protein
VKEARPLEANELRPCDSCRGPVAGRLKDGHNALDLYRVLLDRLILDLQGCNQLIGLEAFFQGSRGVANVFAGRPVARPISTQELLICQTCWMNKPLAEIAEAARERAEAAEQAEACQ